MPIRDRHSQPNLTTPKGRGFLLRIKPDFLEDGKVVTNIDPELYTETPDLMLVGSKRPTHAG